MVLIFLQTLVAEQNSPLSSRRLKETYLSADDEDINALYSRQKVPPDKSSSHGRQGWRASAHIRTSHSAGVRTGNAQQSNKTSLRLEELDFVPNCEINSKEAVSAIHRAKTQFCKQVIANVTCLINEGKLFPKELSSSCPSKGTRFLSEFTCDLVTHAWPSVVTYRILPSIVHTFLSQFWS